MNRTLSTVAWLGTLALALTALEAGAVEEKLLSKCTICHGDEGISDESAYPSIAGIPAKLQADALRAYRDGTRDCGPVPRMCKIMVGITDEEIEELAAYFAVFEFKPADQPFDESLVERGSHLHEDYCEVCHGDGPEDAEKSILHGQWADYLRYSLSQYREGHRKQPPSMRRQADKLTDEDIEALVNFYASYR